MCVSFFNPFLIKRFFFNPFFIKHIAYLAYLVWSITPYDYRSNTPVITCIHIHGTYVLCIPGHVDFGNLLENTSEVIKSLGVETYLGRESTITDISVTVLKRFWKPIRRTPMKFLCSMVLREYIVLHTTYPLHLTMVRGYTLKTY